MELGKGKASAATPVAESRGAGEEFAKVMTAEQVEVLRKQISIYATICEQLLETHRAVTAHQDSIAGVGLGSSSPYCDDPVMVHGGRKFTARQRWSPTQTQLQILEGVFGQGNGTLPGRQKIKDITAELSQHGHVAETNVYNWFQNRRARSKRNLKRKQAAAASLPSSSSTRE